MCLCICENFYVHLRQLNLKDMKKTITFLAIFLIVAVVCKGQRQTGNDDLITVNVTKKNYPKKELILQDFMDVEYIALETNDDFVNRGIVKAIGKEYIITDGAGAGDILIYDRNGKALRKINRRGQGSEEYAYISHVVLDEGRGELFVNDWNKIKVYDLYGKFKRDINRKEGVWYADVRNYDKDNLICWYMNRRGERIPSYYITSKQDGSMTDEIKILFEQWKETMFRRYDAEADVTYAESHPFTQNTTIIHCRDQFIFADPSSDTLYSYLPDHSLIPYFARTPSIQSMNPEVFLLPGIFTDRYFFMGIFVKRQEESNPYYHLMYDRQAKTLFEYVVYNDDYTDKRPLVMVKKTENDEIAFCERIEAYELVESYKKGLLKGKLKEVASTLDEEDNAVIMLVKYRK